MKHGKLDDTEVSGSGINPNDNDDSSISNSDSTSRLSESKDDSSLTLSIIEKVPEFKEIMMMANNIPFIEDLNSFLLYVKENNGLSCCITNDDFILGCFTIISYDLIKKYFSKRTKKTINLIIGNEGLENVGFVFSPRYSNCPLHYVYECYNKIFLSSKFDNYIFISKLYNLDATELKECLSVFKEFKIDDLRLFPYRSEDVYFLNSKNRKNTMIGDSNYRVAVLDVEEKNQFMALFSRELE